jgi:segregation and condensation protein A
VTLARGYPGGLDVDLDVFSGPFDLLVTLVLREEIDLWEVSVSRLIGDYMVHLADTGEFDLETTSQFLVHVATLLEMKSRLLLALPGWDDEEDVAEAEEAGEELLAALVRYTQFRRAADSLRERWEASAGRLWRTAGLPARLSRQELGEERLPARLLADAMAPLLKEPELPDSSHITSVAITLVEELRRLRVLLVRDGGFSFDAVAPKTRLERAVTFFALLELHNRGEAHLRQTRAFADIVVTPIPARRAAAG